MNMTSRHVQGVGKDQRTIKKKLGRLGYKSGEIVKENPAHLRQGYSGNEVRTKLSANLMWYP